MQAQGGTQRSWGKGAQTRTVEVGIVPVARMQRVVAIAAEKQLIVPTTAMQRVIAGATCAHDTLGRGR